MTKKKQICELIETFSCNITIRGTVIKIFLSEIFFDLWHNNLSLFYLHSFPYSKHAHFNSDPFYLSCNIHVDKFRFIYQSRLSVKSQTRLFIKGKKFIFNVENCKYFVQNKDTSYHFLLHCSRFKGYRNKFYK